MSKKFIGIKKIIFQKNLTGNFSESRYFKQIFLSFSKRKQLKVIKEGQQISKI